MLRMRAHGREPGVKTGQTDKQADRRRKGWREGAGGGWRTEVLFPEDVSDCLAGWVGSLHIAGGTRWTGSEGQTKGSARGSGPEEICLGSQTVTSPREEKISRCFEMPRSLNVSRQSWDRDG